MGLADQLFEFSKTGLAAGLGQGLATGAQNYTQGLAHQADEELRRQAEARQQAQFDMTRQVHEQQMAGTRLQGLEAYAAPLLQRARQGDETAARNLNTLLAPIATARNQAFDTHLPIPAQAVGAPIYGQGLAAGLATPAAPMPTLGGLDPINQDPAGILSQSLGKPLGLAAPSAPQETGRSFTNDKSLAYFASNLGLPAPKTLEVSPGATVLDGSTFKPLYTAPNPVADARIEQAKQNLQFLMDKWQDQNTNAQERLRLQGEINTAKMDLSRAQLEAKQDGYDARGDQRAAELRQKWGHDLATFVSQGRSQFMRDNTYVDEDKVKHSPRPEDVAKEEARLEAYYRKNNAEPQAAAPQAPGGPYTLPKNPNPTRSLNTPGAPSGRATPFGRASVAPNFESPLEPVMQERFNPPQVRANPRAGVEQWAPVVDAASRQTGVPAGILEAVMRQESGGNHRAKSPAGAIGLMQLMPDTARGLGVNPRDPAQNVLGGAKYLRAMYDRFGNWESAIAAYNAGPGALAPSKQDAHYQIWQAPYNKGYAETRNYVQSIKADLARRARQGGSQVSALPEGVSDRMAAFYEKHGITPGAADA